MCSMPKIKPLKVVRPGSEKVFRCSFKNGRLLHERHWYVGRKGR
jgi:hypothetical protein